MYHYLFTNDLRISVLDESLKKAGHCFVTNTVPTSSEDKSANNNMMTLGFYFTLNDKSNCAKAAATGNTRAVVLNFIKKFQFPNMRTTTAFNESKQDNIKLAPMRVIVKVLYTMNLLHGNLVAHLTKEEIKYFIFYNENVAKKKIPDIGQLISDILEYRKTGMFPSSVSTDEKEHEWKHEDRQIREMLKVLQWSGCITEKEGKYVIDNDELSNQNKADVFDIITCDSFWEGSTIESYREYMDMPEIVKDEEEERTEVEEKVELIFNTGLETPYERNRIVFGAPGTGKSYLLKEDVKEVTKSYGGTVVERVTFHPEYSYSQFVGTYKPTMIEAETVIGLDADKKEILAVLRDNSLSAQEKYDLLYDRFKEEGLTRLPILLGLYCDDNFKTKKQDGTDAAGDNSVERNHGRAIRPYVSLTEKSNGKNEIAYEYVPGPFMRMYVSALKSARNLVPQPHILIIEEINRAKVAAVFGDVFQLLDRDEDGVSEYDIQASEDIKKYLAKELGGSPEDYKRIRIPDNMFIWATMNSADQGVFPMDTAFKRRWNFEYLGIDKNAEKIAGIGKIILDGSDETIEWNRLRKAINAKMSSSEFKINEDKLMGPFFLSKKAIASNENGMIINKKAFIDAFKSKVIMYLYEDAVKQGKHRFFDGCPDTGKYSAVCDAFDKIGTGIFGPTFREDFYDKED